MTRGNPEREIQRSILKWCRLVLPAGSMVAATENERQARSSDPLSQARFQMARKAAGVVAGWPDLCVCLPAGRTVWIEVKTKTGVVSEAQQVVHAQLQALGHHVGIATDIDTARGVLLAAGVPLREVSGQPAPIAKVRQAKITRLEDGVIPF